MPETIKFFFDNHYTLMDVVKTVDKEMEFRLQLLNKAREVLVNMVVQDW